MRRLFLVLAIALALGAVLIMITTNRETPEPEGRPSAIGDDVGFIDEDEAGDTSVPSPVVSVSISPSPSASPSVSPSLPVTSETLPPDFAAGDRPEPPTLEPQGGGGNEFALRSSGAREPRPDGKKSGIPPRYPEATSIEIDGHRKSFRIAITFDGRLPQAMPNENTFMVVGFSLSGKNEDDDGYAFGAQGSQEGWVPYAGRKNRTEAFPGPFNIDGNVMQMTIPWRYIGGARPFEWYANSSWFSHIEGVTSYLFDVIPDDGGRYPDS
ncbi:MAG: hypothetical protein ACRDLB_15610 [Actinomycetota bacterium]